MSKSSRGTSIERCAETPAEPYPAVHNADPRLSDGPAAALKQFKAKVAGLKRRKRFIDRRDAPEYVQELRDIIRLLQDSEPDARTGVQSALQLLAADGAILNACDDSDGVIGDFFRFDVTALLVPYAAACADKDWLADQVFEYLGENPYGVRDILVDNAAAYLDEPRIRNLIARFQASMDSIRESYEIFRFQILTASLARQIKDAGLYEKTRLAYAGVGLEAAGLDIARVYLEAHEPDTALRWLQKTDSGGDFNRRERQDLEMAIYREQGDTEKQTELAWRIFSGHYSVANLNQLLGIIGKDQRPAVLGAAALHILNQPEFDAAPAIFLIETDQIDVAGQYLFDHADAVDGYDYTSLLWIAKRMEKQDRPLAATILYRALLDSILDRAKSTTYAQGVRYLKKMDLLADKIQDWRDFKNHAEYLAGLRSQHSRKYAFWSKYTEKR